MFGQEQPRGKTRKNASHLHQRLHLKFYTSIDDINNPGDTHASAFYTSLRKSSSAYCRAGKSDVKEEKA